ncbi:hypothetical protein Ddye_004918 [Dipteronia dyeriana]|uniref:Endonuclease/exonuclease/phosphatase domain-containing protein n=1 Tax=Dipteronia dyeriana TaxID=168575 RepID=A0AAD9XFI6_9ROSI|nr:hypothetical protein Ddye_004918 [Dipteronia dyeriana]
MGLNGSSPVFMAIRILVKEMFRGIFLRCLRDIDDLPWVCGGDFNEILSMNEKLGGSEKRCTGMFQFRKVVDDCDLFDLGFTGLCLAWNNKRDGKANIQERLDRFLANNLWREKLWNAKDVHMGFNSSDHRPILLECVAAYPSVRKRDRCFHFEPFWLKEEDYKVTVSRSWAGIGDSDTTINLEGKISRCASSLNGWKYQRD